jgi:drug/metabolite transporter (DMT)-like permease
MNSDIAFALAALICYGLGDVIYKRAADAGIAAEHFLMGQAWFFCPAAIAYAWITGNLGVGPSAWWGGLAGLLLLVGFFNYVQSLRTGAVSVIAPVFRLNFLVTAVLAIGWLGEPVTTPKIAGFALALIAGWLLLGGSQRGKGDGPAADPAAARRSLVQVIVATVAMGAANFCHKLGLVGGATPETLLAAQAIVFCGLVTAMSFAKNGTVRLPAGVAMHSAAAAVVLIAAFLFLLHSMRHADASVVVPIAQMGFGVAAVLGVVLFKETLTGRKLAGLCAAGVALLVLAVG